MQEAEEQDTCRICSAPAEPDQPLFHPCRCSGTIRYIHQDCLTTWLAHSKKKTCETCRHQYSFTKVYAHDMPATLPPLLMMRRLIQQGFYALIMVIRAIVVSLVWLSLVPLVTVWSWRVFITVGDSIAWWISNRQPFPGQNEIGPTHKLLVREVFELIHSFSEDATPPSEYSTILGRVVRHPAWISISADIFTGQIIASLIVITFVAIFLLREWIAQNARPGQFDDEENVGQDILQVPPAPEPILQPGPAAVRRPAAQRVDLNARLALAHRQIEAVRALDALRAVDREQRLLTEDEKRARELLAARNGLSAVTVAPPRSEEFEKELDRAATKRARMRRIEKGKGKEEGEEDIEGKILVRAMRLERMQKRKFSRRLQLARKSGSSRRQDQEIALPTTEPSPERSPTMTHTPSPPSSFFPTVTLEPPNGSIPFSFVYPSPNRDDSTAIASSSFISNESSSRIQSSNASSAPSISPPTSPIPNFYSGIDAVPPSLIPTHLPSLDTSISRPGTPIRRPALPTTLPSSPGSGTSSPRVKTPLASPNLATYRAPEELANLENEGYFAGPSTSALSPVGEQVVEDDEEDDAETLDGHEINGGEENTLPSFSDNSEIDEEIRTYFREEGLNGSDEGESDTELEPEPPMLNLFEPEVHNAQQREEPRVLVLRENHNAAGVEVDEDEDEDEEEDEEEDDDQDPEDEIVLRQRRAPLRAAVAFDAGGVRRAAPLGVNAPPPLALAPMAGPQAIPQAQQGPQPMNADDALLMDDLEAGVEDDMEGALEAIGLRGPIYGLLQNAILMIFIMDTVIGLGIWIPYTLGKSMAFLVLEPRQLLFILHLPIRAIRLLTDPAVDLVAYFFLDVVLPPHIQLLKNLISWIVQLSFWIISESLGEGNANKAREYCLATHSLLENSLDWFIRTIGLGENSAQVAADSTPELIANSSFLPQTFPVVIGHIEPYFAPLGREVRQGYERFGVVWTKLAVGNGPAERIFSVLFGYCIIATALAIYMNILTIGNVKTAGRAVRVAVKQQLLVLKVASFIFIELVTFPLGCGVVLDICTIWFFPNASYASRMEYLSQAPFTTIFYHWVAGTMFMYSFAVLLSGCRSIMRPGGMWFIKDPQDQNAHPIRDILERAALVQLRKICISGVMYTFVVVCTVCSVSALLFLGQKVVLPFRWKIREPLSNIPIDLLFLNLTLPYTMTYFRPRKALRRFAMIVWKGFARRLRLTSYFFGARHREEEYTPKGWSVSRIINGPSQDAPVLIDDYDGFFRRVPNTDDIAIPRDIPATVAVTATGEPVNEEARNLMAQQDAETVKARHSIKKDFTMVYIPPYFRYRMILFVFILWTFGALCLGVSVALPILIGRGLFGIIFKGKREVHDGYSIIAGFYMLWACWVVGKAVDRLDKRRQRWGTEGPRASLWWLALKRGLLWIVKAFYMAFFLGVVIPTLVGVVVELYIILPLKFRMSSDIGVPRIRVLECWATGLLYMKIAMRATRRQAKNPITRGIQTIKRNGWTHPDPIAATKDVIAPVAGGLTGMIVLPGLMFCTLDHFFPLVGDYVSDDFLLTYVYSSLFCLAGLTHTFVILREMLASWSQAVRDKEFLVEMRLKNHDATTEQQSQTPTSVLMATPKPEPAQMEIGVGDVVDLVQENRDV
ncbi:hypothetical protein F5050DRAFT_1767078 [Lentinula boryana]|uniref:RING-type E3 ubiquitin transferase n=1 Tax=Lentinula boryana TaxID=40481 RepID=A0ABQ8QAA3_9AGAR|nr:hypothetical protein F5050DRAFT_1767078 [Lentinula boryana]